MCGIAGQLNVDHRPVNPHMIERMGARLRHRGPDDHGVYVAGHVGLAHRRLSVLDLRATGHQPMCNEDKSVWITFNGEIYNYRELREELAGRHTFRSTTDTEVILHLYEEYGIHCVRRLRGMFAFAIWDDRCERLVLARDRLGKKPLFYSLRDATLIFGSELKALLVDRTCPVIDPVAVHYYLIYQYVPAPRTIFHGIQKMIPGTVMVYENGTLSERSYWSLEYGEKHTPASEDGCREEFLERLRESVRLRMVSDVPVGAMLSGGIDSSAVVALMSEAQPEPVRTFSIGFKEDGYNEAPFARMVAERFKTDHHECVVDSSSLETLPALVRVYDEPFADSSAIATFCLSQLSRQFVTVVLTGDGGDELLGGYPRYHFSAVDRALDHLIRQHRWLTGGVDRFYSSIKRLSADRRVFRAIRARLLRRLRPMRERYLSRICYFTPEELERLCRDEFKEMTTRDDPYAVLEHWINQTDAGDLLDRLLSVDTRTYLPNDLLVKIDRATMAHGLEARSPFLDHALVEFAAKLPVEYKVRNGEGKCLLKSAMRGILPDEIVDRPKQGFAVPVERWMRHEWRDYVRETLLSGRSRDRMYFRPGRIRELLDEHQNQGINHGNKLYALLMLELWHREFVDGATEGQPMDGL